VMQAIVWFLLSLDFNYSICCHIHTNAVKS
jgi:hypothetical protein